MNESVNIDIEELYCFYILYNDGKIANAPVPDLHGCPNINLLEGDNMSSFFPINNKTKIR